MFPVSTVTHKQTPHVFSLLCTSLLMWKGRSHQKIRSLRLRLLLHHRRKAFKTTSRTASRTMSRLHLMWPWKTTFTAVSSCTDLWIWKKNPVHWPLDPLYDLIALHNLHLLIVMERQNWNGWIFIMFVCRLNSSHTYVSIRLKLRTVNAEQPDLTDPPVQKYIP